MHGGDVERSGKGLIRADGSRILHVEVLWSEPVYVDGRVGDKSAWKDLPVLKKGTVKERFQDAAGTPWRTDHVDL